MTMHKGGAASFSLVTMLILSIFDLKTVVMLPSGAMTSWLCFDIDRDPEGHPSGTAVI